MVQHLHAINVQLRFRALVVSRNMRKTAVVAGKFSFYFSAFSFFAQVEEQGRRSQKSNYYDC